MQPQVSSDATRNSFILHRNITVTPVLIYLNKKDKVLEGCVEMCLFLKLDDWIKVLVIDVSIHSEESL